MRSLAIAVSVGGLALVVLVVAIGWASGPARARFVPRWAHTHSLVLTPGNTEFVSHYLRTGRRLRVVCIIGGILLPPFVRVALDPAYQFNLSVTLVSVLLAYLVGTLWAELSLTRPADVGPRSASLSPRRVDMYLSQLLRWTPRAAALAIAAVWAIAVATNDTDAARSAVDRASEGKALAGSGLAFLAVAAIELVQRFVVRRPQPVVASDLLAADDAVRSQSVHVLAGTGSGVLLCLLITPLFVVARQVPGAGASVATALGVASLVAAVLCWRDFTNRAWRVRRATAPASAAVNPR